MRFLLTLALLLLNGIAFAAEGHGGGEPSLFSLDFLFRVINFVILFGGLGYILSKPLKNYLKQRSLTVKQAIEEAKNAQLDAEKKAKYYEERLAQLESEVSAMMEQFKKEAEDEKARIVKEAEEQLEKTKERMQKSLEQEKIRMREEVMKEAANMAVALAEEMIRKNFTVEDQKKWIQEYIKMMERVH
ncbi:MAG: F0F1 ATP synthase subunit B [bacterium]